MFINLLYYIKFYYIIKISFIKISSYNLLLRLNKSILTLKRLILMSLI